MPAYNGLYRATIVNTGDPMGQGRLQVQVPAVSGGASQWALPCRAPAVGRPAAAPPVGATAWVMFEGGDISRPVWMGVL